MREMSGRGMARMARMAPWSALLVMAMACGKEDAKETPVDMAPDASQVVDMSQDASGDQDMAEDLSVAPDAAEDLGDMSDDMADMAPARTCAPFPGPAVSEAPEALALAAEAAQCGQQAYAWVKSDKLGDVTLVGEPKTYSARTLKALAAGAGIELPLELQYDVSVRVISYLTQDRGELIEATAFVAVPQPKDDQAYEFEPLLFLHGTSGFSDGCGPSKDEETLLLSAAIASAGFVIVGPDYVGLKGQGEPTGFLHPYLVGESAAMSSLDALRAAGKMGLFEQDGACLSTDVLVLGGSQGGHAALWVDRLLPYYAPEFTLLGTVATVPPADLVGQSERALSMPVQATANVIAFLTTSMSWYGREDLSEVLQAPYPDKLPEAFAASCDPSDALDLDNIPPLDEVFTAEFLAASEDLTSDDRWGCLFVENGLTTTSVKRLKDSPNYADSYGIYWIMGEDDQLVNTPIERESFARLCELQQMPMQYLECAGASHTKATAWSLPEILSFIDARRQRQPMPSAEEGLCALTEPVRCQGTPAE